jgi:hypothetical protein
MLGPQSESFTGIILPASAIASAAKQVPAPGEEKEKEQ